MRVEMDGDDESSGARQTRMSIGRKASPPLVGFVSSQRGTEPLPVTRITSPDQTTNYRLVTNGIARSGDAPLPSWQDCRSTPPKRRIENAAGVRDRRHARQSPARHFRTAKLFRRTAF